MTVSITPRSTNGRAASCTRTVAQAGPSAARPAATESARAAPPPTIVSPEPSERRNSGGVRAWSGGSTRTTCATSGCDTNGRRARRTIGTPAMGRNCFGASPPSRLLRPAATRTTPTSRGKRPHQLLDVVEPDHRDAGHLHGAPGRAEHAPEAEPGGLGDPALDGPAGTDLAPQPDLAQEQHVPRRGPVVETGDERRRHGEVRARLAETYTRRDLHEHV